LTNVTFFLLNSEFIIVIHGMVSFMMHPFLTADSRKLADINFCPTLIFPCQSCKRTYNSPYHCWVFK